VAKLQRRGRYWDDYDEGATTREMPYAAGLTRVRDDHPAAVYRRRLERKAAARIAE